MSHQAIERNIKNNMNMYEVLRNRNKGDVTYINMKIIVSCNTK